MQQLEFAVGSDATHADVLYVEDRIYAHSVAATGVDGGAWLAVRLRDADARLVAALFGSTWGGCFEIRQFWVDEPLRGRGVGSALLRTAEDEARRRGCWHSLLTTFDFQALAFYRKRGFKVLAVVDDYPPGHANHLLRKLLRAVPDQQAAD